MKKSLLLSIATSLLINFSAKALTYTVINTGDAIAPGSLRWAITQANTNAGADIINFNLGIVGGPFTILISSPLPALTDNFTTIDGFNNSGNPGIPNDTTVFNATPGAPMNANYKIIIANTIDTVHTLLTIKGNYNTVSGLQLHKLCLRHVGDTVVSITGKFNLISGCFFDMDLNVGSGVDNAPNNGIVITGEANVIGTGNAAGANYFNIYNNDRNIHGALITITGALAKDNVIQGNMVGLDVDGSTEMGIAKAGIVITNSAPHNTIGGSSAGQGNVVSGNWNPYMINFDYGIEMLNPGANNIVQGNIIGIKADGLTKVTGNGQVVGVHVSSSINWLNTLIGGNTVGARNIIADGSDSGIRLDGTGIGLVIIQGNYIGVNKNGINFSSTQPVGINFQPGSSNIIGGSGAGEGNVISGGTFSGKGIVVRGSNNSIQGNIIGPHADGITHLTATQKHGIYFEAGSNNNIIGGTTVGARNVISDNRTNGIYFELNGNNNNNIIQGNYIGSDKNGASISGSAQQYGIYIRDRNANNKIGGALTGEANIIAFNTINGVYVNGVNATGNLISNNPIYGLTMAMAIDIVAGGNNDYAAPTIISATTTLVSGTSATNGDIVEVFKTDGACINALQYLGSATVAGGAWSLPVTLNSGDVVIANVHSTLSNNTSEFTTCTILPIEILSFTGKNKGASNLLEWTTASEINNDYFTVERSLDGSYFDSIGTVDGAGNSTTELNYSFEDSHLLTSPKESFRTGFCYYRLKQTDLNGDYTYSNIISITNNEQPITNYMQLTTISPNPSNDDLHYIISSSENTQAQLRVIDVLGKTVIEENIEFTQGLNTNKINVSEISNGTYMLQVRTSNGLYQSQKQFSVK